MALPTLERHGNLVTVRHGPAALYFSYGQLVAFDAGSGPVVTAAVRGRIGAAHLSGIDGGTDAAVLRRLSREDFENAYEESLPLLRQ